MAMLENKSGNYIVPSTESGQAALASADLPADLIAWQSDPGVKDAYPIVTYTWLLCYKQYADKKKVEVLKELLNYCVTDGQKEAEALGYIPLPPKVVEAVKAAAQNLSAAPNAS
jgi:phosphate transport system substrate-binding protein